MVLVVVVATAEETHATIFAVPAIAVDKVPP